MNHKFVKEAAMLALHSVDKDTASQLAGSVVAAVGRRDGHRGLKMVAELVAQGLAAAELPAQTAPNTARPRPTGPYTAGEPRNRSLAPGHAPRSVSRGTLSGRYDALNVGGFSFALMRSHQNVQLSVGQLNAPGNVGGLFSLTGLPPETWTRLEDRVGRTLPVWVLLADLDVELMVGDGPAATPLIRAVDAVGGSR